MTLSKEPSPLQDVRMSATGFCATPPVYLETTWSNLKIRTRKKEKEGKISEEKPLDDKKGKEY